MFSEYVGHIQLKISGKFQEVQLFLAVPFLSSMMDIFIVGKTFSRLPSPKYILNQKIDSLEYETSV